MERDFLEAQLAEGRSLEYIGALVGRDPSTVSYWLKKYRLNAAHRGKHLSRGGLSRDVLEQQIAKGLSVREMADALDVSVSTVRYWFGRHGLRTLAAERREQARAAHAAESERAQLFCRHHGLTDHWLEGRGSYRCLRCRSDAVARRRRKMKSILVGEAGGACRLCGYSRCVGALHFHHLNPKTKMFTLASAGWTRSIDSARAEAAKCVLLCSNCHAEVEAGLTSL
jgi:transposase